MSRTYLVIYPTFAIVNHATEIVGKVVSLYQNNPDIVVVFENQILYDFEYFGYNIKDSYLKIRNAVAAKGITNAELTKRSLDSFVYQEVKNEQIFLLIPNVQQLRSFITKLSSDDKKNVKGIYLLDYEKDRLIETDIYSSLSSINESILTFPSLHSDLSDDEKKEYIAKEKESIERLFKINLKNFDVNDNHTTSTIYSPHSISPSSCLYKVLRGEQSSLWIEKCKVLKRIGDFLNQRGIPNALPTNVYFDSSMFIIEQPYIDGTTLHKMISRRGIKDVLKSDSRDAIVDYLLDISHALYFYHFLGIYISDIKEDNFFYYEKNITKTGLHGVVPIDVDGASLYTYSSSQPIEKYRDISSATSDTFYYQNSITETYSFSYLVYRILFNNNSPINEDKKKCLESWYNENFSSRLERWEKKQLQLWKALPQYVQVVFVSLFCQNDAYMIGYSSEEWNEVLSLYRNDLKSTNAIVDYENNEQKVFDGSMHSYTNQLQLRYLPLIQALQSQNRVISLIKKVLVGANIASFGTILIYIFRILNA